TGSAGYCQDLHVRTVVVSDLHLGTFTRRDLLRHASARAALAEHVQGTDHVVRLGDVLELRETPISGVLAQAEPFFRELGDAARGARVTIVPGNHDHQLAAPVLEALAPDGTSGLAHSASAPSTGPTAVLAEWLGDAPLELAYPGLWIRPDVYATHGHYLDCHAAIPALERLAVAVIERVIGGPPPGPRGVADYEAATEPPYSLLYSRAQTSRPPRRVPCRATTPGSGSFPAKRASSTPAAGSTSRPSSAARLARAPIGPEPAWWSRMASRRASSSCWRSSQASCARRPLPRAPHRPSSPGRRHPRARPPPRTAARAARGPNPRRTPRATCPRRSARA